MRSEYGCVRVLRRFVPFACLGVVTAALPFTMTTAQAAPALPSVIPAWAATAPVVGSLAPTDRVDFVVAMKGRDDAGLAAFANAVSTPGSPQFRHFLTQAQVLARYAPDPASVATTKSALIARGITIDSVSPEGRLLSAHASVATLQSALGVSFARVSFRGAALRVARSEPQLPASVAPLVAAIDGLSQTVVHYDHVEGGTPTLQSNTEAAYVVGTPCSSYWAQKTPKASAAPPYNGSERPYAVCGYAPTQIRSAYGLYSVGDGTGATVAIVDAFDSTQVPADVNTWSTRHGLPTLKAGQYSDQTPPGVNLIPEAAVLDPDGWSGEQTLDAEAVHATAPGANIVYVGAAGPFNASLNFALAQVIEGNLADEVTNSYGSTSDSPDPADQTVFDQLMSDAAAKGIGVQFSSGDDGDELEATGTRSADYPATNPMVTAVGGTTLEIDSKGVNKGETYWGTRKALLANGAWDVAHSTLAGAGGGGESTTYAEPDYQKGVADRVEGSTPGRVVPDVSMVADPTSGFLLGQTVQFSDGSVSYLDSRIGGTSLSCPLWAGLMAVAVQANGGRVGFVNPVLYRNAAAFRDPALGRGLAATRPDHSDPTNPASPMVLSLRTLGNLSTLQDLKGYDDSTGLGTPKAKAVVTALVTAT